MRTITDFPRQVRMLEDVGIVMPDGCRLSARIWLPEDAESDPVPVILEHLPYRKRDGTTARDSLTHPYLAGHGYACIRVDMRGNGDSDGLMEDEYTPQELQDACDVLAWAAQQPWSTGKAGMMGISWGGFNSLQVAAMRPPTLKAIITLCSTVDRYADDIHTKGGCLLGENLGWAATMLAYSSRPPDPMVMGERWREVWLHRLQNQPFLLSTWLRHQLRDDYWKHGSVCEDYAAIDAAVLSVGGWHDGYRNTISHLVTNVAAPVKGIVGPWIHKYPHFAAPQPAIGFLQEALRWWDRWLKGLDTGVDDDPAMRLWLMDSVRPAAWLPQRPGRWIAETVWPSARVSTQTLHFSGEALAAEAGPVAVFVRSPEDTGAATGEYFPFAYGPELPLDQRGDDANSACFDAAPAPEPVDIVGAPSVTFTAAPRGRFAQVAVRLCDIFPDGTSALISIGVLNLTHAQDHESFAPLVPGRSHEWTVTLDQCAYRLPAGHRLRVAISTAYWPFIWPMPENEGLTISAGRLALPVRPLAQADEWRFEEPEAARPWNIRMRRGETCTRRREVDLATGESIMHVENDFGEIEDLDHGLVTSSRTSERWTIGSDDPLSARCEIIGEKTMARGDWKIRTTSHATLSSSQNRFILSAKLTAWENGAVVFERDFDDEIERQGL